jgi:hypothetical protein
MITKALMQEFCSIDRRRPKLSRPWTRNQFTYASDGLVCIRVPVLEDVESDSDAYDTEHLFQNLNVKGEQRALPYLREDWGWCRECSNCSNGFCNSCRDTGKVDFEYVFNGRFYTKFLACPVCEDGDCKCKGSGVDRDERPVLIDRLWVKAYLVRKLSLLSCCRLVGSDTGGPATVIFDGGFGVVIVNS